MSLYNSTPNGGGYELLCAPESELVVIDMPHDGYSVKYLQAVVKSAEIYIHPVQRDLDVTPIVHYSEELCVPMGLLTPKEKRACNSNIATNQNYYI